MVSQGTAQASQGVIMISWNFSVNLRDFSEVQKACLEVWGTSLEFRELTMEVLKEFLDFWEVSQMLNESPWKFRVVTRLFGKSLMRFFGSSWNFPGCSGNFPVSPGNFL